MPESLPDIFTAACEVLYETLGVEPEEVTLETHLYEDLDLHSLQVAEFLVALEERFQLPDNVSEMFRGELGASIPDWPQKLPFDDLIMAALYNLGFSLSARPRHEQIKLLSRHYGVEPYSMGFICACVLHIFNVGRGDA